MQLTTVVLPEPFGPIIPRISPAWTSKLTLLRAWIPPKFLVMPLTLRIGSLFNTLNQFLIKATGGVGIGTNNPQHQLDIVGDRMRIKNSAGTRDILLRVDGGAADIQSETSNLFLHSTGPSGNNHVIINSQSNEGSVGIHTQAPSFTLHVNGTAGKPGGGSWSNSSDRRLKKNIEDLDGSLDQLMKLRGVTFQYKD